MRLNEVTFRKEKAKYLMNELFSIASWRSNGKMTLIPFQGNASVMIFKYIDIYISYNRACDIYLSIVSVDLFDVVSLLLFLSFFLMFTRIHTHAHTYVYIYTHINLVITVFVFLFISSVLVVYYAMVDQN